MNSKQKGGAFERRICKELSRWVTDGARDDVFWRSAMSGGRATIHGKKVRQAGDICAVAPEGHKVCNTWFIECKHVAKLDFGQFMYNGTGKLASFWFKCRIEAKRHGREPMIIAQQNRWLAPIVVTRPHGLSKICRPMIRLHPEDRACDVYLFPHWMDQPGAQYA